MARKRLIRGLLALAVVTGGLGYGMAPSAEADDPEVCGYVRYRTNPTESSSTAPGMTYCDHPCWGFQGHVTSTHVVIVQYEVFVCARNI